MLSFLHRKGLKAGPGYHARYFQLKGYDKDKRHAAIQRRRGAYTALVLFRGTTHPSLTLCSFGTMAMVLNLIPIASIFFTCKDELAPRMSPVS